MYLKHRWITDHKGRMICFACGIKESLWLKKIENDSLANWSCKAIRERRKNERIYNAR